MLYPTTVEWRLTINCPKVRVVGMKPNVCNLRYYRTKLDSNTRASLHLGAPAEGVKPLLSFVLKYCFAAFVC
jgi:hypothetical protein